MGEVEALDKAFLLGRSGGRGKILDYGDRVYGYGYNGELYFLPPYQNGYNILVIRMKTPD